jgi:hypothetical protein
LAGLSDIVGRIRYATEVDPSGVDSGLTEMERRVRAAHDRLANVRATTEVDADISDVEAKAQRVKAVMRDLDRQSARAKVDADADSVKRTAAATRGLNQELSRLDKQRKLLQVEKDAAAAADAMGVARTETDRLGTSLRKVNRDIDRHDALLTRWGRSLTRIRLHLGFASLTIKQFGIAMLTLGPIIEGLVGAATALVGTIGQALVGALTTAGAAATAFGLSVAGIVGVVVPLAKQFGPAIDAVNEYDEAVSQFGRNSKEARDAHKELQRIWAVQPQMVREVVSSWEELGDVWRTQTAGAERPFIQVINEGLRTATSLVRPFARESVATFRTLSAETQEWLQGLRSPEARSIMVTLMDNFRGALPDVMEGIGDLGTALGRAFASASRYFEPFAESFRVWAGGIENATEDGKSLNRWVDEMVNHMSDLGSLLSSTAGLLTTVLGGGAREGRSLVTTLDAIITRWDNFLETDRGQTRMQEWFSQTGRTARILVGSLGNLLSVLADVSEAAAPFLDAFLKGLSGVLTVLNKVIDALGDDLIRALGVAAGAVAGAKWLGKLFGVGSLMAAAGGRAAVTAGGRGVGLALGAGLTTGVGTALIGGGAGAAAGGLAGTLKKGLGAAAGLAKRIVPIGVGVAVVDGVIDDIGVEAARNSGRFQVALGAMAEATTSETIGGFFKQAFTGSSQEAQEAAHDVMERITRVFARFKATGERIDLSKMLALREAARDAGLNERALEDLTARLNQIREPAGQAGNALRKVGNAMRGADRLTLPVINDIIENLAKLPPAAQKAAASTTVAWARELQRSGKLPKGSVQELVGWMRSRFEWLRGKSVDQIVQMVRNMGIKMKDLPKIMRGEMNLAIEMLQRGVRTGEQELGHLANVAQREGKRTGKGLEDGIKDGVRSGAQELGQLANIADRETKDMNRKSTKNTRDMGKNMERDTEKAKEGVGGNIGSLVSGALGAVGHMSAEVNKALKSLGVKKQVYQTKAYQGMEANRATLPQNQRGGAILPALARGGFAGMVPGHGSGDKVLLQAAVEPHEGVFVMNRNAMAALHAWNNQYPRFAAGGMVDPAGPGTGVVNKAIADVVGRWSTQYNAAINYGYDPGGGHVSPGHNITGTATDTSPAAGWGTTATRQFEQGLRAIEGQVDQIIYGSNGIGMPLANHGWGDHAHIEWGMHPAVRGAVMANIKRQQITGPAGPYRELAQAQLDIYHAAATKLLERYMATSGIDGYSADGNVMQVFADITKKVSRHRNATMALGMAGFAESGMQDLGYGHSTSQGSLQLLSSTASGMGIDPHNEGQVASAFYLEGFYGRGGANVNALKGLEAHMVAQSVQGSAFSDGSNYLAQSGPARQWMSAYGLREGGEAQRAPRPGRRYRLGGVSEEQAIAERDRESGQITQDKTDISDLKKRIGEARKDKDQKLVATLQARMREEERSLRQNQREREQATANIRAARDWNTNKTTWENRVTDADSWMTFWMEGGPDGTIGPRDKQKFAGAREDKAKALRHLARMLKKAMNLASGPYKTELSTLLAQVNSDLGALPVDITGTTAAEAEEQAELAQYGLGDFEYTLPQQGAIAGLDAAGALAGLTPGLGDDISAAQQGVYFWGGMLSQLQQQGAPLSAITEAAGNLASAESDLGDLVQQQALAPINLAGTLAGFTGTLNDDAAAAQALVDFWQGQVNTAYTSGDIEALNDALGNLASAQDALQDIQTQQVLGPIELAQAQAVLTPGFTDDLAALQSLIDYYSAAYYGGLVMGASTSELTDALNGLTQAQDAFSQLQHQAALEPISLQQAQAQLTGGLGDDIAALVNLVQYWSNAYYGGLVMGASTAQLTDALNGLTQAQNALSDLQLQQQLEPLQLGQAQAQLTSGTGDDLRAAQRMLDFWKKRLATIKNADAGQYSTADLIEATNNVSQYQDEVAQLQLDRALAPIQLQQAQALLTGSQADDITAAKRLLDFWKKRLANLRATGGSIADITEATNNVAQLQDQVDQMTEDSALSKIEMKSALAALTDTNTDDIAAARSLVSYWESRLASLQASGADPAKIAAAARALFSAREALNGAATPANEQLLSSNAARFNLFSQFGGNMIQSGMMVAQGGIVSGGAAVASAEYASAGKVVNVGEVNNYFNEPPADPLTWSEQQAYELGAL